MLTYVVIVEAIALAVAAATVTALPVTHTDLMRFGLLAICCVIHVELSRGVERTRHVTSGTGPFLDTKSVWSFAAVLILPLSLATAIVLWTHVWSWVRIWRGRRPPHRWVFTAATVVIATQVAAAILAVGPGPYPAVPTTVAGLAVVAAAGVLRWLINYVLVAGAILLSSPDMRASQLLHNIDERILEIGAFGMGLVAAGLVTNQPLLLIGAVLALAAMQRGVLLPQLRKAASIDAKTGLHTAAWWHEVARTTLDRVTAQSGTLAVLMLDLDHFKHINDTHGHLAGDRALHAVGHAINSEIRGYDIAGRWGGEEFAILIPDIDPTELRAIAERLRRRIHALVIPVPTTTGQTTICDLTVSIGGARYPAPGMSTLEDLLLAADTALYQAKKAGRDQVVTTE